MISCRTCAVEFAEPLPETCPVCADERQYVPAEGQLWSTPDDFAATSHVEWVDLLPGLTGMTAVGVGIGQQTKLVHTADGVVVWDPPGWFDTAAVERIAALGPVVAIAASHPHMFGAQVELSHALGGVPVLVNEDDQGWLQRHDDVLESWSVTRDVLPGVRLHQIGGHFPGSAVLHWADGADGRGVLLPGDTIFVNPDGRTVSFQRSYPNRIPLSAAVVERMAGAVAPLRFDYLHSNFARAVPSGAHEAVQYSAQRHIAWVRGDHDDLT